MRLTLGRILAALALALAMLALVLAARALVAPSRQPEPAAPASVAVDAGAAVARLAEALRLRTLSHTDRRRIDRAPFEAFIEWLEASYPRAHETLQRERVGGHSLLYTWRGSAPGAPSILLMAHYDVVPVDDSTLEDWTHPPFDGTVADGHVWGRGALDDKASLVAIMEAVEALLARGFAPRGTVYLAFGHDEEVGGREGAARIASLLEEREVRLAAVLDEGSAILSGLLPVPFPVAAIGVAEKGYVSLELAARGAGGHGSMPPPLTAAGRIARAVDRVQSDPFEASLTGPTRALFEHLAPELSLGRRLVMNNLWLFEPLLLRSLASSSATNAAVRTTTAPTMLSGSPKDNILPDRASAVINFRILPGDSVAKVKQRVTRLVDDEEVAVTVHDEFGAEPSPVSAVDSARFRTVAAAARALDDDIVVVPMLVVGATDSRHLQSVARDVYRFIPVRLTPELIATIHGTDERIAIADHLGMIRFYATLLERTSDGHD